MYFQVQLRLLSFFSEETSKFLDCSSDFRSNILNGPLPIKLVWAGMWERLLLRGFAAGGARDGALVWFLEWCQPFLGMRSPVGATPGICSPEEILVKEESHLPFVLSHAWASCPCQSSGLTVCCRYLLIFA